MIYSTADLVQRLSLSSKELGSTYFPRWV
uniref:Uncharacterized protein n=1 Tax=Anguilla anguilla TaxID=7936 RepID=A0A0E9W4T7_ANGAN